MTINFTLKIKVLQLRKTSIMHPILSDLSKDYFSRTFKDVQIIEKLLDVNDPPLDISSTESDQLCSNETEKWTVIDN